MTTIQVGTNANSLIAPSGKNLASSTRTLNPNDGSLAYDETTQLVYYGKNLTWFPISGGGGSVPIPPSLSKIIYVAKYGNDFSGDGSYETPFLTLAQAITLVNTLSSSSNPITIQILPGIYIENNSSGSLSVNVDNVSIVGDSNLDVFIVPLTPANTLLTFTKATRIICVTFQSPSPSGNGLVLTSGVLSSLSHVKFLNFGTALTCSGSTSSYILNDCSFVLNTIGIIINNTNVELDACRLFGKNSASLTPGNTGIIVSGSATSVVFSAGICGLFQNGFIVTSNSKCVISGVVFRRNAFDVSQTTASDLTLTACDFQITGGTGFICIKSEDAGTSTEVIGCSFDGRNALGVASGSCIQVTDSASCIISGGNMHFFDETIILGTPSDTSSTKIIITSLIIQFGTKDIVQRGQATLNINACTLASSKIDIQDSTNVNVSYFDLDKNNALSVGTYSNQNTDLIHAELGPSSHAGFHYRNNIYDYESIGAENGAGTPFTFYNKSSDNSGLIAITSDRTKTSKLSLISDTHSPFGTNLALRGWDIQKSGTSANLDFNYQNTDNVGLGVIPQYTFAEFNGTSKLLNLPEPNTKIVFGGDTNLYRSAANQLKTDDNFIVGTLTPNRIVATNAITNELESSITTNTELSYLSGVTSPIQSQLNNKVSRSGDTMTGVLQVINGTLAIPGLSFNGSPTTGLSENADNLSVSTSGVERFKVASDGVVSVKLFTSTGVVHNDSFGNLSTSLITDGDISTLANIADTKLATISTPGKVSNSATTATFLNTPSTIVSRDGLGNFSANEITADLIGDVIGSSSLNVLKSGDIMSGTLFHPAGSVSSPSIQFSGSTDTGISASTANVLSFDTSGVERMTVGNSGVSINNLNSTGVVHTNLSGNLTTSQIVDSDIQNATITNSKLASVSSANTSGNIVVRDGSGNFSTNQITISGLVANPTDVATKSYVDTYISTGLVAKTPAVVVSTSNLTLSGLQTIDSIPLVATNRILLVSQTNPVENGLWLVQVAGWTRPTDFNTGALAGQAYVLISSGTINGGSSWLCNTPTAIIGTNDISFALFSLPDTTTGNNVGIGAGHIFKNKVSNLINLKTLANTNHLTIVDNTDDITLGTNGTPLNTVSTLVARNASGNFSAGTITANLTGAASSNVLKSGDSMSGTLNMLTQNQIRFQDASGGQYVGLSAPPSIPTSYNLSLPVFSPAPGQTLRSGLSDPTQLEWKAEGGSITPPVSRIIYVTKYGDDSSGDGSFDLPFASLVKAVEVANSLSNASNPITIFITTGIYFEDNKAGSIVVTSEGVSIMGDSSSGVIIIPQFPEMDFLTSTQTIYIGNCTFLSTAPLAKGLILTLGVFSVLSNVKFSGFLVGLEVSGSNSSYLCETCIFTGNGTALSVIDTVIECTACTFVGATSIYGGPENTGIATSGALSACAITGGTCVLCVTGFDVGKNSLLTASAVVFKLNTYDVVQKDGSHMTLLSCSFAITSFSSDVDIQISGSGTYAEIIGCHFNGKDIVSSPGATCIHLYDGAMLDINGGDIKNYDLCLRVGTPSDSSTTRAFITGLGVHDCRTDLQQEGSSTINLNGTVLSSSKIAINDPSNVNLAYFDLDNNNALAIGPGFNTHIDLIKVNNGISGGPAIDYRDDTYNTNAIGVYNNDTVDFSFFNQSVGNSAYFSTTIDRTKTASINLFSDTFSPSGTFNALRGWSIQKNGNAADLSFIYRNSDLVGQAAITPFNLVTLNGVTNQFQLPAANTQIVFGGDTNLYRSAANILRTDDNFIVGPLTINRVVTTNASNVLTSSVTTTTELGYLSGVTSAIQTQINGKVNKSGDTMTGPLQLPAGSLLSPSLTFTGSTLSGLTAATNNLSFLTNSLERLKITSSGTVSINNLSIAGVVHNDVSGNLTTSLIVNADISAGAAIVDTKLATISTSGKVSNSATTATNINSPNTIVLRDASGNFSAGIITASLNGNAATATTATNFSGSLSGDVTGIQGSTVVVSVGGQSASNVATSVAATTNATSSNTLNTIVRRDASGNFSAGTITANLAGNASSSTAAVTSTNFTGSLSGDVTGTQSATVVSLVGGVSSTNVATGVNLANNATNLNTLSTIVRRDASGNFSAGTITATLNGNALTANTATNFSGSLLGDVTGTQTATVVSLVGGVSSTNVATGVNLANASTNLNTASTIVRRDASGNFTAGTITANLSGLASNATTSVNFTGTLTGDVTGTQSSTVVSLVGGQIASSVASGTVLANNSTNLNTASTIVRRDASGNFSAGTITANLNGNASTSTTSTNFTGSLIGDVTGTQSSTVVSLVGGVTATIIAAGSTLANNSTNLNTVSTIVRRDASGNFSAGTITANLNGLASSATVLQTPRTIYGNLFDGSANLTQIIASPFGGTGNGFTKFSGPTTTERTFTLPDASATILTTNALVTVPQGGTGIGSATAYAVLCGGTTTTSPYQSISDVGTAGQVLTSNGAGALPTFQTSAAGVVTVKALPADQSNATATLTKVTGLDLGTTAGTYAFKYYIRYRSTVSSTGVRFDVNYSGTVTSFVWIQRWVDTSATASTSAADQDNIQSNGAVTGSFSSRIKGTTGRGTTTSVDTINADMLMIIEGLMVVSVAGDLQLYHGSENTNTTTVMTNSSLILTKIA